MADAEKADRLPAAERKRLKKEPGPPRASLPLRELTLLSRKRRPKPGLKRRQKRMLRNKSRWVLRNALWLVDWIWDQSSVGYS